MRTLAGRMNEDNDRAADPSKGMIEHLAHRLVERYGPDAANEADQIVRLLTEDGNLDQARVWAEVRETCRRMAAKAPGALSRRR